MTAPLASGGLAAYSGGGSTDDTQLLQMQQLALNHEILTMVNPWMGQYPEMTQEMALSGLSPEQLADQGASMFAMQSMDAMSTQMQSMNPIAQRALYGKLTSQQQKALVTMGYQNPEADDGFGLGDALGLAAKPIGMAWQGVAKVGGPIVKPSLEAMVWLGDQPAHMYRTIRTMDGEYQVLAFAAGAALALGTGGAALGAMGLVGGVTGTLATAGTYGMIGLAGAGATAAIFNHGDFIDAWNNTYDGERVFSQSSQQRARELLVGDQYVNLAKEVALEIGQGFDLYELATEVAGERGSGSSEQLMKAIEKIAGNMVDPGTPEYEAVFSGLATLLQEDPFRQAVDALNRGKISFGRDLAGLAFGQDSQKFNVVSGMMDGAWLFAMDPLLMLGNANRGLKIARKALPTYDGATDVGHALINSEAFGKFVMLVEKDRAVNATFRQMGRALTTNNLRLMPKASRGMFNSMRAYFDQAGRGFTEFGTHRVIKEITETDILEYFREGTNFAQILGGKGTVRGYERIVISTSRNSGPWGRFVVEGRGVRDAWDDKYMARLAAKHGVEPEYEAARASRIYDEGTHFGIVPASEVSVADRAGQAGYLIGEKTAWIPGTKTAGRFLGSITAMAPESKAVKLVGDGMEDDLMRWVDSMGRVFNMPSAMRDEWLSTVMRQGAVNQRMNVMSAYLDSLFEMSGVYLDDTGKQFGRTYLQKVKQAYALGGADQIMINGLNITTGVLPWGHQATHLLMPNLDEMMKLVQRGYFFKHVLRITDSNLLEAGMSRVWKPSVILRIGFIPRAAGEEALAWFARMTEGGVGMEFGARMLSERGHYATLARKASEGKVLTLAENNALKWRMPAHTRVVYNMATRLGHIGPEESTLRTVAEAVFNPVVRTADHAGTAWGTRLAPYLDHGLGYEKSVNEMNQIVRQIIMGREHSWRNLIAGGVDPALKEAADSWVLKHADSVMRGTSAMTHSVGDPMIVHPDTIQVGVADPNVPGGVRVEERIVVRHERVLKELQDPGGPIAMHHRLQEPFNDKMVAPVLADGLTHQFPYENTTFAPTDFVEAARAARSVETYDGKLIAAAVISRREDVWRAVATSMASSGNEEAATVLRGVIATGDTNVTRIQEHLFARIQELRAPGVAAEGAADLKAAARLEGLLNEIEGLKVSEALVERVDADAYGWLQGALPAQIYSGHTYYDADMLDRWSTGATETVAKRPERVFYRGIKGKESAEVAPNGDLLVHASYNTDWDANVISFSRFNDQSLGYAVSPGNFNEPGTLPLGAQIEVDGDFLLAAHGRTMPELEATAVSYPRRKLGMEPTVPAEFDSGLHMIGWGEGQYDPVLHRGLTAEDRGEVAVVGARNITKQDLRRQVGAKGRLIGDEEFDIALAPYELKAKNGELWDDIFGEAVDPTVGMTPDQLDEYYVGQAETAAEAGPMDPVETMSMEIRMDLMELGPEATPEELAARLARQREVLNPAKPEPFRIPASKWSIQSTDQMKAGTQNLRPDTRWPWLADVQFETPSGGSIPDLLDELSAKVAEIRAIHVDPANPRAWLPGSNQDDAIDEFVLWVESQDPAEAAWLAKRLGFNIEAQSGGMRSYARNALNDNLGLERYKKVLDLRGQGGFATETLVWNPFYEDQESMWRGITESLSADAHRAENAEAMRATRRTTTTDGKLVARPPQENTDRIYMPTIGHDPQATGMLDDAVNQVGEYDELGRLTNLHEVADLVADQLLAMPESMRLHTRFMMSLSPEVRKNAVSLAVEQLADTARNGFVRGSGMTDPLHGAGYNDPRVAQWVSDVLNGGETDAARTLAQSEIPRGLHGDEFYSNYGPGGNAYKLGPERDASTSFIDADGITMMPDGSYAPGASTSTAFRDQANVITEYTKGMYRSGSKQSYQLRDGAEVYRYEGTKLAPLSPRERLSAREDLFSDPLGRKPIDYGDKAFFESDLAIDEGGKLLHPVIGPILHDHFAQKYGMELHVPKKFHKPEVGQVEPVVSQNVLMAHARVDDISLVADQLPNQVIAELTRPLPNKMWDRIVRFGFNKVIGPALDSLVRRPMSFHYYAAARKQNMQYVRWMLDTELFDVTIPKVFGNEIAMLGSLTDLTPAQLAAVNLVDTRGMQGLGEIDQELAKRWIASQGATSEEYVGNMAAILTGAQHQGDALLANAADTLMQIDQAPFKVAGISPLGTSQSESMVLAFRELIPPKLWDQGAGAINNYNHANRLGLPVLNETRFDTMHAGVRNYNHIYDVVEETAATRALENVIPFLDDHSQRSQFSVITRNLLPFWYAEEQFIRRWARTLAIAPDAIRKGQLLYMGMRSAGVVRTDVNGQDWVVYPGSGLLTEALSRVLPGDLAPVGVLFQASTNSLLPGLNENVGQPALSPLAAMPVDFLTKVFPEMTDTRRALLGEAGASKTAGKSTLSAAASQLIPTTLTRIWDAAFADDRTSARYASAIAYAAANLQAEGKGLPDDAQPADVEDYLRKLRNHARIIMVAQAFAGFVVPGSPQAIATGEDIGSFGWLTGIGVTNPDQLLSDTYRRLVQNQGIDEGTRTYLNLYPNSDLQDIVNPLAFITSTTHSVSGAPLPATRTGLAWYQTNKTWIDEQPEAGAWFLPHDSDSDQFDNYAYSQQVINDLRKGVGSEDFIRSMMYREAAEPYFRMKDEYEKAKERVGNDESLNAQVEFRWDTWKQNFMASHPIFAEEIQGTAAAQRRQRTVAQLRYAVDDPSRPASPNDAGIGQMVRAYDAYRIEYIKLSQDRKKETVEKKARLKQGWEDWTTAWIIRNPELERLWTSVYRPESNL